MTTLKPVEEVAAEQRWTLESKEKAIVTALTQYHQDLMSEVVEKLEEKRRPETWTVMTTPVVSSENIAYNQALTEAQTIIRTLLKSKE